MNAELKIQYKEKTKILRQFIENNSNLAKQGSKQWLLEKQFTIGGSEMAVITGQSAFSNIHCLVAQKVGLTKFNGNAATRWGNLFEGVSEKTFAHLFLNEFASHKIYSTGSIPHWDVLYHKYSPDGLCVLEFENYTKSNYKISLLEFKSPHRSVPDHKVPKHYIPQLKAGLCTLKLAENAIFVNNMFKKCHLKQLDFSISHDEVYHQNSKPYLKNINYALAHGIILFSIPIKNIDKFMIFKESKTQEITVEENDKSDYYKDFAYEMDERQDMEDMEDIDEMDIMEDCKGNILDKIHKIIQLFKNSSDTKNANITEDMLIDLGAGDSDNFEQFLELYKPETEESPIEVRYLNPQINTNYMDNLIIPSELGYVKNKEYINQRVKKFSYQFVIQKFIKKCVESDSIPLAVLPWKLFRSSNILVEREQNYVVNHKDDINKTINIIKKISNEPDLNSKAKLFDEYYPDSGIIKEYYLTNVKEPEYYKQFIIDDNDDDED